MTLILYQHKNVNQITTTTIHFFPATVIMTLISDATVLRTRLSINKLISAFVVVVVIAFLVSAVALVL